MLFFYFLSLLLFVTANILIGCFAAILLGFGPPNWQAALNLLVDVEQLKEKWHELQDKVTPYLFFLRKKESDDEEVPETKEKTVVVQEEPEPEQEPTFENIMENLSMADIGDLLEDESDDFTELAPIQEIFDDELATALMDQGTESWLVSEKHVETSILKLNVVMMKSGLFAAELDQRIRLTKGSTTMADVKQFLEEMKDDCRNYLESQASLTEQMLGRLDEFGELKYLAEEVEYANMEQSAQIETTLSNLDHLVLTGNPEEGAARLIKELAGLRIARHRLRDLQDRTFIKIVFYEKRVDTIPQQLYYDEVFGLRGRIGLEVAINEWWKQKRNEKRQLTFALIDFVRFGEANEEHGIGVCDKIIKHFGKTLETTFDTSDLVGIYNGNCFLVATLNAGLKKTVTEIERIRQRCDKTTYRFMGNNEAVHLQVTCAITEALATQSHAEVLSALEHTLAVAKKEGRNHTFLFIPGPLNTPPERVEAPNLGEEPKEIEIE